MSRNTSSMSQLSRLGTAFQEFRAQEAAGGLVLMAAAALALVLANSPMSAVYFQTLHAYVGGLNVLHWVNDGLMAIFFLLVGLEIKREVVQGQLATTSSRILPGMAALGGMVVPAMIYIAFNLGSPTTLKGWAIPAATDIAFALGVVSLLGKSVPISLKIFLTALAITDDLGAVVVIALFYTEGLNLAPLLAAALITCILIILGKVRVTYLSPYLILGAILWYFMLKSGVHTTLAGVVLALTIPLSGREDQNSPLMRLEHGIQGWVAFLVVPVFGLANAGVSLRGYELSDLAGPVPLGVAAGLLFGKQLGVFGFALLAIKARWASLPDGTTWRQMYGLSLLCGIGFTMSLFIGMLAFPDSDTLQSQVKLGVLMGSVAAAIAGAAVLGTASLRGERQSGRHPGPGA